MCFTFLVSSFFFSFIVIINKERKVLISLVFPSNFPGKKRKRKCFTRNGQFLFFSVRLNWQKKKKKKLHWKVGRRKHFIYNRHKLYCTTIFRTLFRRYTTTKKKRDKSYVFKRAHFHHVFVVNSFYFIFFHFTNQSIVYVFECRFSNPTVQTFHWMGWKRKKNFFFSLESYRIFHDSPSAGVFSRLSRLNWFASFHIIWQLFAYREERRKLFQRRKSQPRYCVWLSDMLWTFFWKATKMFEYIH